jgi:uncharacterized repeat protein (TIGR02543 family)
VAASTATFGSTAITTGIDTYNTDVNKAYATPENLSITANFDDNSDTGKKIVITLAPGLGIASAPGLTGTTASNNWSWEGFSDINSPYYNKLTGATYTAAGAYNVGTNSAGAVKYNPTAGKLTYNVAPGQTSLTVGLTLKGDSPFLIATSELTLQDLITIEVKDSVDTFTLLTLDNYVIAAEHPDWPRVYNGGSLSSVALGATYSKVLTFSPKICSATNGTETTPAKFFSTGAILKYLIPKELGVTGVDFAGSVVESAFNSASVTQNYNATHDLLTVNLDSFVLNDSTAVSFKFVGKVTDNAEIKNYSISALNAVATFNLPNGSTITKFPGYGGIPIISILANSDLFTYAALAAPSIHSSNVGSPATNIPLGGFGLRNQNISTIDGKRLRMETSSSAIKVTAVRLISGPAGAKDIVVHTDGEHNPIYIASKIGDAVSGNAVNTQILTASELGLAASESITSVEYTLGAIPSAYVADASMNSLLGISSGNGNYFVPSFYGRLLSATNYQMKATILTPTTANPAYNNEAHWTVNVSETRTETITIDNTNHLYINILNSGSPMTSTLVAGNESKAYYWDFGTEAYRRWTNNAYANEGFTAYVREASGLYVDPATVKATYDGVNYPYDRVVTDNSGAKVYVIHLPEAVFGAFDENLTKYSDVRVFANISALSSAPSGSVEMKDIFMLSSDEYVSNPSGYVVGSQKSGAFGSDSFGILPATGAVSADTTLDLWKPTPANNYISIEGRKDILVSTYAGKGDGNWFSYNSANPASVIGLNTKLPARYQVKSTNNSGVVAENGYTALIPIPKIGENTDNNEVQTEDFTWSLYLNDELGLSSSDYDVYYATSYELTTGSANWKNWEDVVANKANIRMIKVVYKKSMAVGATDIFDFAIGVPQNQAEATAAKDKVNIYSSYIYKDIPGVSSGYSASTPVALKLATGVVSGKVQLDVDRSGTVTSDDTDLGGITVNAYEKDAERIPANIIDTADTKTDGSYQLFQLDSGQHVDIEFVNNGNATTPYRFVLPSVGANNANVYINDIEPSHVTQSINVNALIQEPYTVTFHPEGGTPAPDAQKVYTGAKYVGSAPTVNKRGFDFGVWKAGSTGGSTWDPTANVTSDLDIYATWNIETYDIGYTLNGGLQAIGNTHLDYNVETETFTLDDPSKTGYDFNGWTATGGITIVSPTKSPSVPKGTIEDIDFEAHWTPTNYTISYELDDGTNTEANIAKTGYTIESEQFSIENIEKTGYDFDGWTATSTDGTFKIEAASTSASVPKGSTGNITFVAHFTPKNYSIGYELDSGINTEANIAKTGYNIESDQFSIDDIEKRGYTFNGWTATSTDGSFAIASPTVSVSVPKGSTGNITFIADFTIADYTISYELDGGVNGVGNSGGYVVTDTPKSIADATKDGYVFTGWTSSELGINTATKGVSIPENTIGNITLTAHFAGILKVSASNVSVSFDGNAHGISGVVAKVASSMAPSDTAISYSDSKNGTYSTTAPTFKDAGTYTVYIKATHTDTANYVNSAVISKTVTISKRAIAVKPVDAEKVYDGSELTHADVELVSGTLVNGHNIDVSKATFTGSLTEVGTATGTVSGVEISGGNTGNYDIAYDEGTLTVTAPDNGGDNGDGGGDNGGGDNGTGGQNDGNDDNTVVDEPKEPKVDTPKPATTNTKVTRTPAPATPATAQATIAAAAAEQGIPTFGIGGNDIPLVAPFGVDSWSLANLLFMIATLVFAIYTTIAVARRRKYVYEMGEDSKANPRYGLFAITIAMAIASVVLFFTTQDLTQGMALVDVVSPEFVVALAVNVIAAKKVLPKIDGSLI